MVAICWVLASIATHPNELVNVFYLVFSFSLKKREDFSFVFFFLASKLLQWIYGNVFSMPFKQQTPFNLNKNEAFFLPTRKNILHSRRVVVIVNKWLSLFFIWFILVKNEQMINYFSFSFNFFFLIFDFLNHILFHYNPIAKLVKTWKSVLKLKWVKWNVNFSFHWKMSSIIYKTCVSLLFFFFFVTSTQTIHRLAEHKWRTKYMTEKKKL